MGLVGRIPTNFLNAHPLSNSDSSIPKPCFFNNLKTCSIYHRAVYQFTICKASSKFSTLWVVSSFQLTGFGTLPTSFADIHVTVIDEGYPLFMRFAGHFISQVVKRNSIVTYRLYCFLRLSVGTSIVYTPATGVESTSAYRLLPFARFRVVLERIIK